MRPPRLAEKLILFLCHDWLAEEILGDLDEAFEEDVKTKSKLRAKINYWLGALKFINTRTVRRNKNINNNAMIKNYFIIAVRNLKRQKIYSFINIGGLAVGIACSILLGLYIVNELSYDRYHENAARIVAASIEYNIDGEIGEVSSTPTALLPTMQDKFPEVERGTRFFYPAMFRPVVVSYGDKAFQEPGFCYADSTVFDMFSFNLIEGNRASVLDEPNNIVLTESSKTKYFGDEPALNETLIVDGRALKVTGVMEDVPDNSSIKFDFIASFSTFWKKEPIWYSANYTTYVEFNKDVSLEVLESKIQSELVKGGLSDPDNGQYFGIKFTPLLDVHLYSQVFEGGGDIMNLYIFGSIALLILAIAIINYTNLTVARSFYRVKEVGLRKSLGAFNKGIFTQIIGESFITVLLAMLLSMLILYFIIPLFTEVSGSVLSMGTLLQVSIFWKVFMVYILTSIIAGIYPAMKMSRFKPVDILKGTYSGTGQGAMLRKSLIVAQFFISLSLIIATVVIYKQLSFINNKELGYSKENVLVVPVSKAIMEKTGEFKSLLLANDNISAVSIVGETPPNIQGGYSVNLDNNSSLGVVAVAIDESYIETTKMRLLEGRAINLSDLSRTVEEEEYSFIINESAARSLNWQITEAVGQRLEMNGRKGIVQGLVKDFHFRALYEDVLPLVMFTEESWAYNYIMIRINANDLPSSIENVSLAWKTIDQATPFSYSFLDQEFTSLHADANRTGSLLATFAVLAIFLASLGLFGIVSFSMVQRAKEIGIRKVLGASIGHVLVLANKEFLILILLAFIFAVPATYWLVNEWLLSFAYHTNFGAWPILAGLFLTTLIAFITISIESLKAALANPVETLKNE